MAPENRCLRRKGNSIYKKHQVHLESILAKQKTLFYHEQQISKIQKFLNNKALRPMKKSKRAKQNRKRSSF